VYTVTLELFPTAPVAGTDFTFRSSIVMSTDIYVAAAAASVRDELGPDASYLSLFHLRADLVDAARPARDLERAAVPIGSAELVPVGDGFGYRLEDESRLPHPVVDPAVTDGFLEPFTLSVGIRPEQLTGADRILTATAGDFARLRCSSERTPRPSWRSAFQALPKPSCPPAHRASRPAAVAVPWCRCRWSPGRTVSWRGGSSTAVRCPESVAVHSCFRGGVRWIRDRRWCGRN